MIYLSIFKNYLFLIFLIIILTLLVVFLYALPFIISYFDKRNFNKKIYKILYNLAMERDFYLINNFPLISNNNLVAKLDHILFSDKYIYVINDKVYSDIIKPNKEDSVWESYTYKGEKENINNPLYLNNIRCDKFSSLKNINRNYIISIVVVNNLAKIDHMENLSDSSTIICKKKDLLKVIKNIEKRKVSKFNLEKLDREVKEIAKDIYSRS